MSRNGAISCDPDTDQEAVFVQSDADGCITFLSDIKMEPAEMLTSDMTSPGSETVINQTSFDIPQSSVAETVLSDIKMEPAEMLTSDMTSPGSETVINQTSFDIPQSSVAETVDCGADLTEVFVSPVMKENTLPLHVSRSQLEKQNVIMCEVIHNGSEF